MSKITILADKHQLAEYIISKKIPTNWVSYDGYSPYSDFMAEYSIDRDELAKWSSKHESVASSKSLLKG